VVTREIVRPDQPDRLKSFPAATGSYLRRRLPPEALSVAVLVPFLVLAVRALAWPPKGGLIGDQAVMDLQIRQALHWHLQLGVYDRFGWHHPGPVYLYIVSFVYRLLGVGHGAQALVVTAALINGLSALGVVVLVRRFHGGRAALWATAAVAIGAALMGSRALDDPWSPYVVIGPLLLFGMLVAAAMRGSLAAFAGSLLVGSAAIQTDVATLPLIAVSLVLAMSSVVWARRTKLWTGRRAATEPTVAGSQTVEKGDRRSVPFSRFLLSGALLAGCALLWVPVERQQATGTPGNLTLIWRFFSSHRGGPGLTKALAVVGNTGSAVFGLPTGEFQFVTTPGLVRFSLIAATVVGVAVLSVALRSGATNVSMTSLAGLAAAVVAADHITGMPWGYLLAWAAAPVALAIVAAGIMVGEHIDRIARPVLSSFVALSAIVALTVVCTRVPLSATTTPDVTVATDALMARYQSGETVGLTFYGLQPFGLAAGVADQLVLRGISYAVPSKYQFGFPFSTSALPDIWEAFTEPGAPIPRHFHKVATTPGNVVSIGTVPPPHWWPSN
jgi:hypothetical protein